MCFSGIVGIVSWVFDFVVVDWPTLPNLYVLMFDVCSL